MATMVDKQSERDPEIALEGDDSEKENRLRRHSTGDVTATEDNQLPARYENVKTPGDAERGEAQGAPLEKVESVYPADSFSAPRQVLFLAVVCMAMFMTQAGLGNTLATVRFVGESFGLTNPGELAWLIAGYSLTVGTFILFAGRLGDEFGNKKLYVIGMAWYATWSLVAGLAVYSGHVLFVFARVFQGMGPAITLPNALAIFGKSYSQGPKRNMAFAWFGAAAPLGAIAGFTFGALFAQLTWWPWVYWSQAIALAVLTVGSAWLIPPLAESPEAKSSSHSLGGLWHDLDIPGSATGVLALVLFNFAWNQAVVVGWQEPYVYVCLILGVLFAVAFFWVELKYAKAPLLPISAFNADIAFVFGYTAAGWACFGIWVFYIIQVAVDLTGVTPLQIAAWFTPVVIVGILSAVSVGKLLGKIAPAWIMVTGGIAYTVGSTLAATRPPDTIYWTYFFFSVIIQVVGMDTSFPAASIIFSNAVPKRLQGMGASIVMTIVNYSISLGLGFAGTLETNINHGGLTPEDRLHGYRGALWLGVGLGGLALALSLTFMAKTFWLDKRRKHTDP